MSGKWAWPIRISSFILFVATVAISSIGFKVEDVSNAYHLYITPSSDFFIIWAFIYSALAVVAIYNLVKNEWTE